MSARVRETRKPEASDQRRATSLRDGSGMESAQDSRPSSRRTTAVVSVKSRRKDRRWIHWRPNSSTVSARASRTRVRTSSIPALRADVLRNRPSSPRGTSTPKRTRRRRRERRLGSKRRPMPQSPPWRWCFSMSR